tara:strand:- start:1270 stop:1902 length:633 start_codon:yes stop_codon:yes gene_type:complete
MSRAFPTAVATALSAGHVVLVTFAKLEFPSGTIYVHNSIGTYTWGGQDWLGTGSFGDISQIEEGADVSPYKITLTLSGLDATVSGAALTEDYYMHPVTIYLGALDADDSLIDDPTIVWEGVMDQMDLSIGAEGGDAIQLTAESELARFDKASNKKYTHSQQQDQHSGDLLFEFMADIEGAKIRWGDASSDNVAGSPNPPRIYHPDFGGEH